MRTLFIGKPPFLREARGLSLSQTDHLLVGAHNSEFS